MASSLVVGLDLGCTAGCCAVHRTGGVDVVPNEQGQRTTPAIVAFTEVETLLGEPARAQLARSAANTVVDGLRLLGRNFDDAAFQEESKGWRFRVSRGKDGVAPQVLVGHPDAVVQHERAREHLLQERPRLAGLFFFNISIIKKKIIVCFQDNNLKYYL